MAKQNSKVSKNYSCLFCSNPTDPTRAGRALGKDNSIILSGGEVESNVLKMLCNHLMPNNKDDIPEQFTPEMFPFCTSCKDLVAELWECQEVIRKTQLRMAEITTRIEKKVVEGVILDLDDQMPSSAATLEKRFIKLRDVILKHYRETLIFKRKEELTAIQLDTSSPISVISEVEVNTAEASCSVIVSSPSSTKCDTDVNDATGNESAEPALGALLLSYQQRDSLPEVSIISNESNEKISLSLLDSDSLFEEEHHVIKSESQSELEMEDLNEDMASGSGGEANQVVASVSPPGTSKPLRKTTKRMSNTGTRTQRSMAAQRKGPRKYVARKSGTFEGTRYKVLKNKRIKCGCCNHIFSLFGNFQRHVRKESHQCGVCKKIFTRADHLKSHQYKSHGAGVNEKFPCPHCGIQYARRGSLSQHLRNNCKGKGRISVQ